MAKKAAEESFPDELRIKGILSKGYGQLSKIVMLDPLLSLEAKAIYAYFCSYCGGGNTAFPGRDKIVSDLHINKDTYYKHFKMLVSNGYISVQQRAGNSDHPGFHHNIYTIESFPLRFNNINFEGLSEAMKTSVSKVLAAKDIASAGYGNIPKSVMCSTFSIQAKGIYAYLSTFTGQDFTASPSKDVLLHHLKISHNSASKYVGELINSGFVSRRQLVINGRFSGNIYYLEQQPDPAKEKIESERKLSEPKISDTQLSVPEPRISDTEFSENITSISDTIFSDTEISDTKIPDLATKSSDTVSSDAQETDTNKPNSNTNKKNNICLSIYQSDEASSDNSAVIDRSIDCSINEENIVDEIFESSTIPYRYTQNILLMKSALKTLTEWDLRSIPGFYTGDNDEYKRKLYLLFIESLSEMMCKGFETIIRGARVEYPQVYDAVVDSYLCVSPEMNIISLGCLPEDVIDAFIEAAKVRKITNLKNYMKAIIWTVLQDDGLKGMTNNNRDNNSLY